MSETSLRDALNAFASDWQGDLSGGWKSVLEGIELDHESIPKDLKLRDGEVIFPGRKGNPDPRAPVGAHVFKALDRLQPKDVRAVIIGQDPYPRVSRATGRAFEQGDIKDWSKGVTTSMKSLLLTLATERTGSNKYFSTSGWSVLQEDMKAGLVNLPASPEALFDSWEEQGVLLLNAGLTLSRFVPGGSPEQRGHIQFWSPLIKRVIQHLVERKNKQLVFLAWGDPAGKVVANSGVTGNAAWNVRAGMSQHPHPASNTYWTPPNPLGKASVLLKSFGGVSINW